MKTAKGKQRMTMKYGQVKEALTSMAILAGALAFAADSVDWPADFDSRLAAHVRELKPSGDRLSASPVFLTFDSRIETRLVGTLAVLRNYAQPGFLLFLR